MKQAEEIAAYLNNHVEHQAILKQGPLWEKKNARLERRAFLKKVKFRDASKELYFAA